MVLKERYKLQTNIIIYHDGYSPIESSQIINGKYTKNFGTEFYCTEIDKQVIRWAKRYGTPVINIYHFETDNNLNILHF